MRQKLKRKFNKIFSYKRQNDLIENSKDNNKFLKVFNTFLYP
jgi:hypothetical protein